MPQLPAKIAPRPLPETAQVLKEGYIFSDHRWEGEEYEPHARSAAHLVRRAFGLKTGLHTGLDKRWNAKVFKQLEYTYYRVFLYHPTDGGLYAWWTPTAETWCNVPNPDRITWFEFEQPKEEKK